MVGDLHLEIRAWAGEGMRKSPAGHVGFTCFLLVLCFVYKSSKEWSIR